MKIRDLIEELQKLPPEDEVISFEIDDWQEILTKDYWRIESEWLFSESGNGKMIILKCNN